MSKRLIPKLISDPLWIWFLFDQKNVKIRNKCFLPHKQFPKIRVQHRYVQVETLHQLPGRGPGRVQSGSCWRWRSGRGRRKGRGLRRPWWWRGGPQRSRERPEIGRRHSIGTEQVRRRSTGKLNEIKYFKNIIKRENWNWKRPEKEIIMNKRYKEYPKESKKERKKERI